MKRIWPPSGGEVQPSETVLRRVRSRARRIDAGWFGAVLSWNEALGADPQLLDRARVLQGRAGCVVLTGQQVGLFGGPLYCLYKLLSAVELARALEATSGIPVVPVFWLVGDDSDFGEVSAVSVADAGGAVKHLRDTDVPSGGTLTGSLPVSRQSAHLEELSSVLSGHPHGARVAATIAAALGRASTWSEFQAALFHAALGERSALVLDGGSPAVLEAAQSWLRAAAGAPLGALLSEGAGGEGAALDPELGERSLFHVRDGRRQVATPELAAADLPAGGWLAPNVVLRPLLQDLLLPNVATVCGPSEVRYRSQLGPLYRHFDIPEPLRPARFAAVLVPSLDHAGSDALEAYRQAARDPAGFVDARVEAELPADLIAPLVALRGRVATEVAALTPRLEQFDRSLPQLIDSAAGKADYQFDRMIEGIRGKTRHRLQQRCPGLASLADFVSPRQRPQERVLSWWTPLAAEGFECLDLLAAAARERSTAALVRAAAAGGGDGGEIEPDLLQLEGMGRRT